MSDFLEKAICLQLFCAGEKLNVRASKVSLVRYNDKVRNLLGVQTIRMNMWTCDYFVVQMKTKLMNDEKPQKLLN